MEPIQFCQNKKPTINTRIIMAKVQYLGLGMYRVVKQNCQVEKIVNLGHQNDFMTQKSSLIFLKTIFG